MSQPTALPEDWITKQVSRLVRYFRLGSCEAEDIETAMRAVRQRERERCATIAEDPSNLRMVGGSTGNAWDTAKAIADAIRKDTL